MTLILICIGILAGILSGLFGIGGGIVIVPALVLLAKFSTRTATGTSLGALLLPVGILGAWTYYKHEELDVRASLLIATGLVIGIFLGAQLAQMLSETQLRKSFSVFLALVAVKVWLG